MTTVLLVIALIGAYVFELASGGHSVCAAHGFVPAHPTFETALSSLFLHDPESLLHLGCNLVFLVVLGSIVEKELGSIRFLALYFAAGLGGAGLHSFVNYGSTTPLVGASASLFGLLAVAGVLRPRLLGFVVAFAGVNVWHALVGADGNVSFAAHIGGFAVGAGTALLLRTFNGAPEAA